VEAPRGKAGARRGRAAERGDGRLPGQGAALRGAWARAADLLCAFDTLHVFRATVRSAPARAVRTCLVHLAAGRPAEAAHAYARAFAGLAAEGFCGDAWRAHLASRVAVDANAFTLSATPAAGLEAAARSDLRRLETLAASDFWDEARRELGEAGATCHPWTDLGSTPLQGMAARLYASAGWEGMAEALARHARAGGAGRFARHLAYRWRPEARGAARLEPVVRPDLVPEEELVGYTSERRALAANTERLLRGLPAQDVLLYGDRGTGKSSSVKALLTAYAARGLRLVELGRRHLGDLPRLWELLGPAPQRFVVFVDDLSFEEDETGYKDAKSAMQGGLAARPGNVVVYATSNRRHLVRERFSERGGADDPRGRDAVEEKLSLADRFGLTLVFAQPDQDLFLSIVDALAERRGVGLPRAELHRRALAWALAQGGRSGRAARQFVDSLVE
jgi:predicted AAA+ superfamily ATPase